MKLTELKIKRVSLADEARTIRKEEKKLPGGTSARESLYLHRTGKVRSASRYAHLAHAFLTGRAYKDVEYSTRPGNEPSGKLLAKEVKTFHPLMPIPKGEDPTEFREDLMDTWLAGIGKLDDAKAA